MFGLLIFILIIALGLYGLNEYYKIKLGVTHVKTSQAAMEALANLIEDTNTEQGRLLHLGSGTGGFVLGVARRLPEWDVIGVEQSPTPWILANLRTIGKQFKNYRFYLSDAISWPLKNYDIVFLNHDEKTLRRWEQSLARRLQPETLLITLNRRLPRITPTNTIEIDPSTVFHIYQRRVQAPAPTPEQIAEQVAAETVADADLPPTTTIEQQQTIPIPDPNVNA